MGEIGRRLIASRRFGIRVIAVIAIASVALVWAATAAGAKPINSVSQLKGSCAKAGGGFISSVDGSFGVCLLKDGGITCDDQAKGAKCQGYHDAARELVPTKTLHGANGLAVTTQAVTQSHVWKQTSSVGVLSDTVCASLGGKFIASADTTFGACATPTATIICNDTLPGTNCVGVADTKKHAASVSKQAKTVASKHAPATPSTTNSTTASPTTTRPPATTATPTTKAPVTTQPTRR